MSYLNTTDLTATDYFVLGQATCFSRIEGEVKEITIVEPIPSAALEALIKQTPTSYSLAYGSNLGEIVSDSGGISLPDGVFDPNAQLCDDFVLRSIACARTYKAKPQAQELILSGKIYREFDYSLERKRMLSTDFVVKDEDNVKQHSHTHQVL